MKLKPLLVLLNIVLVVAIVLCFFSFFSFYPPSSWPLDLQSLPSELIALAIAAAFLVLLLACVDIFLLRRAKLLDALIAENWPAVSVYFERKMLEKGRFSRRGLKLFISVLVLLSDSETLCALFSKLKKEKPSLYSSFAPDFIAASVIFGSTDEASSCISFILSEDSRSKAEGKEWAKFYEAFLAFRDKKYGLAAEGFSALASSASNPLARGVSGYFCASLLPSRRLGQGVTKKALIEAGETARAKTRSSFTLERWQKLCAKARKRVRAAVIGKTIASATEWLFE